MTLDLIESVTYQSHYSLNETNDFMYLPIDLINLSKLYGLLLLLGLVIRMKTTALNVDLSHVNLVLHLY